LGTLLDVLWTILIVLVIIALVVFILGRVRR
jgi:cbb3-type cytochrome oxidase subunit 3